VRFPWPWSMRADLSYGIYVYHWPLLQLAVLTPLARLATPAFIAVVLAIVVLPAAASWYLVEKPAMSHKHSPLPDRLARRLAASLPRAVRT
jgi:peptidoglycan/LPS O-acetylase OafA/YrhL